MKIRISLFIILGGFLFITSCNTISRITSRDNSIASESSKHRSSRGRGIEFLDGIELSPGMVVSRHRTPDSRHWSRQDIINYIESDPELRNANIEKVNFLQIKYSLMTDATVERLNCINLLQDIDNWWGTPYIWGGMSRNGVDCSAFTQALLRDSYHVNVPRTAQEQYDNSVHINQEDLKTGDLVFFHTIGRGHTSITHVGMYLINNKFVNSATRGGVMISDLNDPYWKNRFRGAGRVLGNKDQNSAGSVSGAASF